MSSKTSKQTAGRGQDAGQGDGRRERLAKELRANLLKRKALAKARAAHEQADASVGDDPA